MFERLFGRSGGSDAPAPAIKNGNVAGPAPDVPAVVPAVAPSVAHDAGLARTRRGLLDRLADVFGPIDITPETWEDLELQLVAADVGASIAAVLVEALRARASQAGVRRAHDLPRLLRQVMVRALADPSGAPASGAVSSGAERPTPWITLMVGVNGSGKTTTAAKLAARSAAAGHRVLLVAADTFRAAAVEQLAAWAERVGVDVIRGTPGGDPSAVVFDALRSQAARRADRVIIDTAGRLHTQHNLMQELAKIVAVIGREMPGAPHETLLVLDATTGQNGLAQARHFLGAVPVTALVLAKLDGSAKGGVAFPICRELALPIAYIGTGEGPTDLAPFDAAAYVDGLLGREGNSAR